MKLTAEQLIDTRAALEEVLNLVRNDAEVATRCGIKPQNIVQWKRLGRCAHQHAHTLAEMARERRFEIPASRLRPDVFRPEPVKRVARK